MGQRAWELALDLETLPDTDSEELAALIPAPRGAARPRRRPRGAFTAGEVSEGANGAEVLTLDGLVVQFVLQPEC